MNTKDDYQISVEVSFWTHSDYCYWFHGYTKFNGNQLFLCSKWKVFWSQ